MKTFVIQGTSPAAPGTAVVGDALNGLGQWDSFVVDATIRGGTGGVLDAVLWRKVGELDEWREWIRFPQVAAGVTKRFTAVVASDPAGAIVETGAQDTATPAAATVAANTVVGGHPGQRVRLVVTAGASTSAGAAQHVTISARRAN